MNCDKLGAIIHTIKKNRTCESFTAADCLTGQTTNKFKPFDIKV